MSLNRIWEHLWIAIATSLLLIGPAASSLADEAPAPDVDRSPVDVALGGGGAWLVTANQTSNSVSLIDLAVGKVVDEQAVGTRPEYVAVAPDGKTILVSCSAGGVVEVLTAEDGGLAHQGSISIGFHPHGLAITRDGRTAYVAMTGADQVGVLNLETRALETTIPVGRWPRYLALAADDTRLAVGASGDRGVTVVDTAQRKALFTEKFTGLNIGHMQGAHDGKHVFFPWVIYRANPISPENIRLGWVLATRVARMRVDEQSRREALSLDPPGKAVGDPFGLALTSDDAWLVVSASGTHELLVMQTAELPLDEYGGTDHLPYSLRESPEKFDRILLGGRPMGLRIAADDRTVYVANYLNNSVQHVDLQERRIVREISLGGPATMSEVRRGEAIFYDARYSLDQWYSCHTCHYNGGPNAERMDTLNDGTRLTFKTVLPLYDIHQTPPYTWHGWQEELADAVRTSITTTMQGTEPSEADVQAVVKYLETLQPLPNPFRQADGQLSAAAERGRQIFETRAGCIQCHDGPQFSDGQLHDVGLTSPSDKYPTFNTPTLLRVYERVRLLHDGRVKTLDDVLRGPHDPAQVTGVEPLSDAERSDLIEYLKSL